jgi:GWxTD domain-containing protein
MKPKPIDRGAALRLLPLLLFLLVAALAASPGNAWIEDLEVPGPSEGGIIFYADVVTFMGAGGTNIEEIYCTVANDQLVFVEEDESLKGQLRFTVKVLDESGVEVTGAEREIEVFASSQDDADDRSVVQVFQSRLEVEPGSYTAQIKLEDLNARKKEIVSFIRGKYNSGEMEVQFDSGEFGAGRLLISDIQFARSLRRASDGPFHKSGFEVTPNPHRRYGLLLNELPIYFDIYDLRDAGGSDTLLVSYSIINKTGNEIFEAENPVVLSGEFLGSTALFDITSLSADSYQLVLKLLDDARKELARSERKFDVVWSVYSWGRYEIEALGDLTYIFTAEEAEEFKVLSSGEQEEFLRQFWLEIDPSPGTSDNEALREHFRRVQYADRHFGIAGTRGTLTDRGRLYIKYGQPDDIQSHYSDYEWVQGSREMSGSTDPVPTDPFSRVGIKTGSPAEGSWDQAGSTAEQHADQRGGSTVHGKAYEIWTYDHSGTPVRRLSGRLARSAGMRFVLVDEKGFGEYRLVYSTEKQEY